MTDMMRKSFLNRFWGAMLSAYERMSPVEAYMRNTRVIEDAYSNGTITMREVRYFLGENGDMLREKGFDPWEVICGKGLQW